MASGALMLVVVVPSGGNVSGVITVMVIGDGGDSAML